MHDGVVDAGIGFRPAFFEQNSPDHSGLSLALASSLDCRCVLSGASVRPRFQQGNGRRFVFVRALTIVEDLPSVSTEIPRFPDVQHPHSGVVVVTGALDSSKDFYVRPDRFVRFPT